MTFLKLYLHERYIYKKYTSKERGYEKKKRFISYHLKCSLLFISTNQLVGFLAIHQKPK